jgi:hypothetical protein
MGRVVTGVTLKTLPEAVRKAGLRHDQEFSIVIEDRDERRARSLLRMRELSAKATALAQKDGIVSDEDVETFLNG